ncbi:MAG: ABC transporter substrate-binding protein [Chloroflexota bacterium]
MIGRLCLQRSLAPVLAIGLLVSACVPAAPLAPSPTGAAASGVSVLRLSSEDFGYPQPYTFSRGPGNVLLSYIFDTLIWHDANGYIPWLAKDWSLGSDGLTWDFTLRPNVKWQDGQPLSAADVVFSFEYLREKPNPWWASALDLVDKVEQTSDTSVRIVTKRPYAPFLTTVAASIVILPQHIWANVADPRTFTGPTAFVGSGPYRLSQYDAAQGTYLFDANPDFFLGAPFVKRIELVPAPNELIALQQGQIDAGGASTQDIPTDEVLAPFSKDPARFGVLTGSMEWTMGLFFNMSRGGPLADVRFRQAVAYAIDWQDLVNRVLQGKGQPAMQGQVAPTSSWFNPNVDQYPYDAARANQLLDDAGYSARGADGMRMTADGKPLAFELDFTDWDSPRNPELLKSYLMRVGINVVPKAMERNARDAAATEGRYEMILVGFGGTGGDLDGLRARFDSHSQARSFTRVQGYANPRFDELATQQLAETDAGRRKQMGDEMQAILADDVPMLSLYVPQSVWLYRKGTVDDWYFAYGWYGGGTNGAYKQLFVTGQKTGATIKKS